MRFVSGIVQGLRQILNQICIPNSMVMKKDYFLITNDFTQWAYENDILMSPGRGSASGSLVCWLLGITHLDPIKYELFFERFMNPERIKEPDIDNDFQDNRRADVKNYVASKWGEDNTASVAAYCRYSANTLFRDLAKDKGIDYKMSNKIAKTISGHISLNKSLISFTLSTVASLVIDVLILAVSTSTSFNVTLISPLLLS